MGIEPGALAYLNNLFSEQIKWSKEKTNKGELFTANVQLMEIEKVAQINKG